MRFVKASSDSDVSGLVRTLGKCAKSSAFGMVALADRRVLFTHSISSLGLTAGREDRMQLSEAIRLGAMIGPQLFTGELTDGAASCAIGSALLAVGCTVRGPADVEPAIAAFPIMKTFTTCPVCRQHTALGVIVALHLNDRYRWTRERIADWVASVEPALSTTSNRTPDGDAVPVRPTAEMNACSRQDVVLVSEPV